MLDKMKNYFDDFTFHARVMPVVVAAVPILLLGLFKGVVHDNIVSNTLYVSIMIVFIGFAANTSREQGKKCEKKMYDRLKAMPTTIILRYTDKRIDDITKTRYHKKLNEIVEGVNLPLALESENEKSDIHYESAMNHLRIYANANRKEEPRVYQELKEYNFWRNLYGVKYIAITIYFVTAVREYFITEGFNWSYVVKKPYPEYMAFIIMIVSVVLFVIFVTKSTVEGKAFDYAKTLAEVCQRIKTKSNTEHKKLKK